MSVVEINGAYFAVRELRQTYVQRQTIAYRLQGVQQRQDDASVNRYLHRNFLKGFGANRIERETGKGLQEFRDATCLTDYPSGVYLPLLAQTSTEPTGGSGTPFGIRASTSFGGNLWAIFQSGTGGTSNPNARRYAGSTTSWTGGGDIAAPATFNACLDIISYKTGMIAFIAWGDDHTTYTSTDGATWTKTVTDITVNLLSNAVSEDEEADFGLLTEIGNEKVAVVWDEVSGTITFFSGTMLTGAWADEALDIPSGNGPQGVAVYHDIDGTTKLYVMTREGLWMVDTSPATWTARKVLDLPAHNSNGKRMTVHQGKLWFGVGVDDNSPAPIWTMEVRGDLRIFDTNLGLDKANGLPAEMMGPIRWMKSAGKLLFASIGGGAASRNGRVIVHNGEGWHSRFRNGTANQQVRWIDVSPDDDGTQRLHFALRVGAGETDTQFLAQPLVDPAAAVTMAYATSGYLRIPDDDLGDPQSTSTVYRALVSADDLTSGATTSDEYIRHQFGVDGAADTTSDLTNYLSGTKVLTFPAGVSTGVGSAALTIANRLTFNRNTAGTPDTSKTPKLREFEIQAENRLLGPRAWDIVIDIEETARQSAPTVSGTRRIEETIIANLETIAEGTTLVTFTDGEMAQTRVRVPVTNSPDWKFEIRGSSEQNLGYRVGTCTLRLEEAS